jgi:glycerophosphoryl diester phosphodiesterase
MRAWWGVAAAAVLGLGLVYGIAVIRAEPARNHPLFPATSMNPLVIAHRGGMHLWPENTVHAFRQAARLGVDMIEMDLRTTADGVIVVLHDATVDRTTDGSGPVHGLTLDRLKTLDAGYRWTPDDGLTYPYRGQGLTIPTLEEVLAAVPGMRLNLEIKQARPTLVPRLCETIRRFRAQHRVLVASFQAEAVHAFRDACPEVATSATPAEARAFLAMKMLPAPPYMPPVNALQLPERLGRVLVLTPSLLSAARAANFHVHAFTVNDTGEMRRLLDLGVNGIVTDRPDLMLELLGRTTP